MPCHAVPREQQQPVEFSRLSRGRRKKLEVEHEKSMDEEGFQYPKTENIGNNYVILRKY